MPRDDTLIVSATYDDSYPEWYDLLPEPKVRISTAEGGHPSGAFVRAYLFDQKRYHSYLFLQDSLEPVVDDVVAPFRECAEAKHQGRTADVVAWAFFNMFFDTPEQKHQVERQYPYTPEPPFGFFGPIFWATRRAMDTLHKHHLFPRTPENKTDAQGTERAWPYAFSRVGITARALHPWSNEFVASGDALPFRKVFAGRQ